MRTTSAIRPEINVTPLIDILLVMLVIFLAAVTLTQQAIESQLPKNESQRPKEDGRVAEAPSHQIMLEVSADRQLAVNSQAVTAGQLEPFLRKVYSTRTDKTIYVAAAGSLPYGAIIDVMDAAKGAGVTRVGVITERMRRSAEGKR